MPVNILFTQTAFCLFLGEALTIKSRTVKSAFCPEFYPQNVKRTIEEKEVGETKAEFTFPAATLAFLEKKS